MKKLILCLVFTIGCGSLNMDYVKQDRRNYETLWPCIEEMLETSNYPEDKKQDIRDRGESWDLRTTEALKK